jgi:hypothetical protein
LVLLVILIYLTGIVSVSDGCVNLEFVDPQPRFLGAHLRFTATVKLSMVFYGVL